MEIQNLDEFRRNLADIIKLVYAPDSVPRMIIEAKERYDVGSGSIDTGTDSTEEAEARFCDRNLNGFLDTYDATRR